LESIIPIIKGVDLLYHEATFTEELKEMAKHTGHSTALEAATIAQKAAVKKLILGHFSNRYTDYSVFEVEAKQVFENTHLPKILEKIKL
jgi:ribonuclease Z